MRPVIISDLLNRSQSSTINYKATYILIVPAYQQLAHLGPNRPLIGYTTET